jgi:hypothetical protein
MQETIDREGIIESLVFMSGNLRPYFEGMTDERLLEEYDRRMNANG